MEVAFISSGVEVRIRKQLGHLFNEAAEKFVRALPCRIHCVALAGNVATTQIGVGVEPRCGVTRHVELWDHPNTAIPRVCNDLLHFFLRVVEATGCLLLQKRESLAFNMESRVIRKTPMKDVQLDGLHCVEIPLDHRKPNEPVPRINQKAAPREAWTVLDRDHGNAESLRSHS